MKKSSVGSNWSVVLVELRRAGSYYEIIECLRATRNVLEQIDYNDRVKYCKADYEAISKDILRKNYNQWGVIFPELIKVMEDFFVVSSLKRIPRDIFVYILCYLPVCDMKSVLSVSKELRNIGLCDELWRHFYEFKFLSIDNQYFTSKWIESFRRRFEDPEIGDKVEVAWRGKFRLETQDVYQGLAWWRAEIVDKHRSQYKIHYPGWESRWDEWVPKNRLRWVTEMNPLAKIEVGDVVELWCCGTNVPGAWLESKVKKIKDGKYCLGKVISSGYLWIERDRIRLVRKSNAEIRPIGDVQSLNWNPFGFGSANCIIM